MSQQEQNFRDLAVSSQELAAIKDEISESSLYNEDLAPTGPSERTWSTYHMAALWVGIAVAITTYTIASGLIATGMAWWQAFLTITLGNILVLVPCFLNGHAGTRYGIPFPILVRSSFGVIGANFAALARALVACGWFGIQTWIGGLALNSLTIAIYSGWADVPGNQFIAFLLFWAVQVAIILRGMEGIKILEAVAAPLLIVAGVALLAWALSAAGGLTNTLSTATRLQDVDAPFWALFLPALAVQTGYQATLSLNISDFTRYTKSQRSQIIGQSLGLPLSMAAFSFIGIAVTAASIVVLGEAVWNPVELVTRIAGPYPVILIIAMVIILVAQITTNMAANVVAPSNDFSNLAPRYISFKTGGLITAALGIFSFPWILFGDAQTYVFTWLGGYGSLMGAFLGVMIADYWILRRTKLDLADLYKRDGRYAYYHGWNWKAIAAIFIGILPVIPGFLATAVNPGGGGAESTILNSLYTYGLFFTLTVAGLAYLALNLRPWRSLSLVADSKHAADPGREKS